MSDLADAGRLAIGMHEFGLTEAQSKRLRGDSADEVRADAKQMRVELGLDDDEHDDRERDDQGRFAGASMNRIIRRASGRP